MGIGSGVVNKDAPCSHPKRDELFPLLIRMISILYNSRVSRCARDMAIR